ncbi:hypothetical protein QJS04_geneDACA013691 [Acorus gramineus]|uniref:Uncharacterized protein n=1 Tax=Acorus gramineus TaxID=55184 RepID=A0AAV9AUX5_ACOGR|nr:hypothetical protein QJS04_geneDACA013691 [Acorus gramineus]
MVIGVKTRIFPGRIDVEITISLEVYKPSSEDGLNNKNVIFMIFLIILIEKNNKQK